MAGLFVFGGQLRWLASVKVNSDKDSYKALIITKLAVTVEFSQC